MTAQQLELFKEFAESKPIDKASHSSIIIEIEGRSYHCSDLDISKMEQKFGPSEDENGVNFWWLLRQLKSDGVKRITLI